MEEPSVQENRSEEAVLELVLRLLGAGSAIPTDNRAGLMDAIQTAHGLIDAVTGGLGTVTIRSLSELTAAQIEALFATDEGVRYALLRGDTVSFSGLDYSGDLAVLPADQFSLEFVQDRVRFVQALAASNAANLGYYSDGDKGSRVQESPFGHFATYQWHAGSELHVLRPYNTSVPHNFPNMKDHCDPGVKGHSGVSATLHLNQPNPGLWVC